MTERTYMLAAGVGCSPADIEMIREYVTTSADFSSWWNHIPLLYMVETTLTADAVAARIHELAPEAKFLLTGVDLAETQGWLPEISWKWIEKRAIAGGARQIVRI